jgi:tetratricopeptide (TPR) repeat protein
MSAAMVKEQKVENFPASTSLFTSPKKRTFILCLLLVVATLALYNPVSRHPFLNFDDGPYVTENPHIRGGLSWDTIVWSFRSFEQANWHPLTWLSHALDWQFFHLNPSGHHYTSVLLHVCNAVLLFLLLQRATGHTWRSLMVAALFALHPVNVESVAWIAERKNVLSMFFFLLTLQAYGWYARKPALGRYALVLLLFASGLMSKPQVITLPFILLLWDYWPLRRMFASEKDISTRNPVTLGSASGKYPDRPLSWLILEKLPLLVLSFASAVLTMKAQREGGAMRSFAEYSFSIRWENALVAYVRYIGKAFWPTRLSLMYPHPDFVAAWKVGICSLLITLITIVAIRARRQRYLAVGWFWFLGSLVPMIGLVQVGGQAMADRYAYISFIGLFIIACWSVADWIAQRGIAAYWPAILSATVLLVLAAGTARQIAYWSDNISLWSHTLQITHDNYLAEDSLAEALIHQGEMEQALPHLRRALQINASDPVANINVAAYDQGHGRTQEAIQRYQLVLQLPLIPGLRAKALGNLASAYCDDGDFSRGAENYQASLRLDPNNQSALVGLGLIDQRAGNLEQAVELYSRAVALQPTDVIYLILAKALDQAKRPAEAQSAREKAQQLSRNLDAAQKAADNVVGRSASHVGR